MYVCVAGNGEMLVFFLVFSSNNLNWNSWEILKNQDTKKIVKFWYKHFSFSKLLLQNVEYNKKLFLNQYVTVHPIQVNLWRLNI